MPTLKWLGKIDEGGHAQVWKAEDELGRIVAVKLLDPSIEQFSSAVSHARALARAKHPHVVDVYYLLEVSHPVSGNIVTAIVMECLQGKRLDDLFKIRQFTAKEVRLIGEQVIAGLAHIHGSGLAHGDLHPGNVIVDAADAKIIDILYLDTLNLLSTMSKNVRLDRDCLQLRMLLADLLEHSELDFGEVRSFNTAVSNLRTLDEIREAFYSATDPDKTSQLERRVEFAYQRFSDPHFVNTQSYAAALDAETDADVVFPLLMQIIDKGVTRKENSLYLATLWNRLTQAQQDKLLESAAQKLDKSLPDGYWYPHIALLDAFGGDVWARLPRVHRLRIEAIMTQDILSGRIDVYSSINRGGELGTWTRDCGAYFDNRKDLIDNICTMLTRNWYTQNYIGTYLLPLLPQLADTPSREARLKSALKTTIKNDASRQTEAQYSAIIVETEHIEMNKLWFLGAVDPIG